MALPFNSDRHMRRALSTTPLTHEEQLKHLELGEYLSDFALNPSLTDDVQEALVRSGAVPVKEALARNDALTVQAQAGLAVHAGGNARASLALRRDLTPQVQRVLLHAPEWLVRCSLAVSPSPLDSAVVAELSVDPAVRVREALAHREDLAAGVAKALSGDADQGVRSRLADNKTVELGPGFAVAFLELSERGRTLLDRVVAAGGDDSEALGALRSGWTGTLGELIEAARTFAPNER